ncbi:uncharacterized protein LOC116400154 [Anarrhichthys ocellatus]|uniref:uncharacterized protein LOC116400154 n=1 Tax=Anarrhichthys ocellatus TaxID=433405 RepID=UPI0012EE9DAC|nr:uncharacterized protein LOC116400154 [Anarrhichthys ocellatus]
MKSSCLYQHETLLKALEKAVVRCSKDAVLLYSRIGGDALLPCFSPASLNCSLISWTFYRGGERYIEEVSGGRVREDSDKSSRLSVAPNCSLALHDLIADDAGSYVCLQHGQSITAVYVSVLAITSPSTVTELQPGRRLALSCTLFTYYDAVLCRRPSTAFNLNWAAEDGAMLRNDTRHQLIFNTSCHITLVTELKREDNNRKWRCQTPPPSSSSDGPVQLPISRIVLCVALPVMVLTVGFFTWRGDRKRAKASAAGIKLQEIN